MKLIGVEIPFDTLYTLEPDTVLVVISDQNGIKKLVKIDNPSLAGWRSGFARGDRRHNGGTTAAKRMLCMD